MAHPIQSMFEDFRAMQQRLKRNQKEQFLQYAENCFKDWGFEYDRSTAEGKFLKNVNLETRATEPEFVIMAHYDTPTIMPPWIEFYVRLIGHTRPLLLFLVLPLTFILIGLLPGSFFAWIWWLLLLSLATFFIPNPYNYNDNTSGLLGLLYLAKQIGGQQQKVKFVLVDNEELGLIGANHLKNKWRKAGLNYNRINIISLDCIGWGDIPVIIRNGASPIGNDLIDRFQEKETQSQLVNLGVLPINDNYVFRDSGAVVVTRMNKALWNGGYYIKNIHLPFDRKLDLNKIKGVCDVILDYIETSSKK